MKAPPAEPSAAPAQSRLTGGTDALALGLVSLAERAGRALVVAGGGEPPLGALLDRLGRPDLRARRVTIAVDPEPAGVALGAAWGGAVGVALSAGPGLGDFGAVLALASAARLPLIVIHASGLGRGPGFSEFVRHPDTSAVMRGLPGEARPVVLAVANAAAASETLAHAYQLAVASAGPAVVLVDALLTLSEELVALPPSAPLPAPPPGAAGSLGASLTREGSPQLDALAGSPLLGALDDLGPPAPAALLVLSYGSAGGTVAEATDRLGAPGVVHRHLTRLAPWPNHLGEWLGAAQVVAVVEANRGHLFAALCADFPRLAGRFRAARFAPWPSLAEALRPLTGGAS